MPEYYARKPFNCARCGILVPQNSLFAWDNTNKSYDEIGKQICFPCHQSKTAGNGSLSPTASNASSQNISQASQSSSKASLFNSVDREYLEAQIKTLQDRVAALEKIIQGTTISDLPILTKSYNKQFIHLYQRISALDGKDPFLTQY